MDNVELFYGIIFLTIASNAFYTWMLSRDIAELKEIIESKGGQGGSMLRSSSESDETKECEPGNVAQGNWGEVK